MKPSLPICFLVLSAAFAVPVLAQAPAASPAAPASDKDKLSYALGLNVGGRLKSQGVDLEQLKDEFGLDEQTFMGALHDGLTGATPKIPFPEVKQILTAFQQQMQAKSQESGAKNKQAGEAFLTANKSKPGVVTLPDGLQYKVIKDGTGPMPKATDKVTVEYKGTLIDGTVFDSSDKNGGPLTLSLNHVIPGWTEALQKMKVGSKWTLYIPSDLAYGEQGQGGVIPPAATLVFDVQLNAIAPGT